ncbi:inositol 1,4,5-triphosphate receptor associated 2 [Takifugu flavidus]|uniref:inositol 1,4,5-triphosphate receptor associated 2 n=1 Tax=Takifugu flavidus TaxID=433684 RepID=UPI0025444388|nr:inositol 1,4,5-triphosphate receptor associated 2 [Takifugu flavidus]
MDAQPEAKTDNSCPAVDLSEDSDEETSQDESPPVPKWNELSIIERVGLNSVEMSEKDLEMAFAQIAMAFHCDQYTLKQRLQAEEHARNLAEENIQLELSRGRETLETLKGLCIDSQRSRILQRLELSLDILAGTVERISNTAEVLGAVHQEARVSRAVELMLAHVENLRRQHDKNVSDLEEAKKLIQQQSILSPRACSDPEDSDSRMRSFQQNSSRRRVSMSLISRESQVIKRHLKKRVTQSTKKPGRSGSPSSESSCSVLTKEDNCLVDDRPANPDDPPSAPPPPAQSSIPDPDHLPKHPSSRKMQRKNSPPPAVRQRHRITSSLARKKADKDKRSKDVYHRLSVGKSGSVCRRPLALWLDCCRWMLLFIYMLVLFCVITLTFFLLEL